MWKASCQEHYLFITYRHSLASAVIYALQNSLETILKPLILINLLHDLDKMAVAAGTKVKHLSKQRPKKTKSNLNKAATGAHSLLRKQHVVDTRQLSACWHEGVKVLKNDQFMFLASYIGALTPPRGLSWTPVHVFSWTSFRLMNQNHVTFTSRLAQEVTVTSANTRSAQHKLRWDLCSDLVVVKKSFPPLIGKVFHTAMKKCTYTALNMYNEDNHPT